MNRQYRKGWAMAVARLEIAARTPYQGGMTFGEVGAYERIDGTIHFAVDPMHPANVAIVDLDTARRDAAGRVAFSADFCLLQPIDPTRANRRLLFDVVNRGSRRAVHSDTSWEIDGSTIRDHLSPGSTAPLHASQRSCVSSHIRAAPQSLASRLRATARRSNGSATRKRQFPGSLCGPSGRTSRTIAHAVSVSPCQ